MRITILMKKF